MKHIEVRATAVKVHDDNTDYFVHEYEQNARDPYSTAFTYGRKKMDEMLNALVNEFPKGSKILDVGCGTGEQVKRFLSMGYSVKGIEPAPEMRALALKNNPGTQIDDGIATQIPFADSSFDLVVAIEVFRYLHETDVLQSYKEMLRVTRPGGKIFFSMVNRYALDGYYPWHVSRELLRVAIGRPRGAHCEFQTPGQIKKEFAALGNHEVRIEGRMLAPLRFAYRINSRFGRLLSKFLEPVDNFLATQGWHTGLAGHLLVVITRR